MRIMRGWKQRAESMYLIQLLILRNFGIFVQDMESGLAVAFILVGGNLMPGTIWENICLCQIC